MFYFKKLCIPSYALKNDAFFKKNKNQTTWQETSIEDVFGIERKT